MIATLPQIFLLVVYVAMLAGLGAILVVPFFPGLLVIVLALLAYVGYASYMAHNLAGIGALPLALIMLLTVVGLSSSWWSEKLGLRFTSMRQQATSGAILGSFVGLMLAGTSGLIIGMILGVAIAELISGRSVPEALRQGAAALMSLLGPRGFQFLMALWVVSLELAAVTDVRMLAP